MGKFSEGLESAAGGAVIGLGSSVLGGLADSLFGSDPTETQKEMMDYQSSLNAGLMRLQAELNSPATIAKEYQKAGFNPYVTMGSGSGSSGGQAAGSSVSIPEAAYSAIPSQIGMLTADTLSKLAGAYKTAKEGSVVKEVTGSQIFRNYAEGLSAAALANLNKIEADFKTTYGDKLYQGQIGKYAAEVAELYQRANLAMAQGNLAEAQDANEQLKQVINNELAKQEGIKSKMLAIRLNTYPQLIDLEIKGKEEENRKLHAEGTEAYASASEHQAGAREKTATAEFKEFDNSMRKEFKEDIFNNYALKLRKEGQISKADYYEALRRSSEVEDFNKFRDRNMFVKAVDDLLTWFASKVNIAISGSVSKDVK